MSSAFLLPAKRPRSEEAAGGGGGELRARLLEEQALLEEGPLADVALVGLMPEQVVAALQGNAQRPRRQREPVLAGVDARTARAYTLVGNALFTWPLEMAELGRALEEPADRSMELLDRQGYPCVTAETPAVAVLCPLGARAPVAVVLSNGRLVYRELERNGAKAEYAAQLESGEHVTAATWEVVGGQGAEEGDMQVMAFLGTSHGRVYRVGPIGSAGGSGGSATGIASGPMHKPQGLADYLPWRIRGPGPQEGVRSLLTWERPERGARHVLTLTGECLHLYDAHGTKVLEQLHGGSSSSNDAADGASTTLLDLALLRPGLALLLSASTAAQRCLSLSVVDARDAVAGLRCVHLADLPSSTVDRARVWASGANTSGRDIVAFVVHPIPSISAQEEGARVTVLHFHLRGLVGVDFDAATRVSIQGLRTAGVRLPVTPMLNDEGDGDAGILGAGPFLCTDALAVLAGQEGHVLRVRALRHAAGAGAANEAAQRASQAAPDERQVHTIAGVVRAAFEAFEGGQPPAVARALLQGKGTAHQSLLDDLLDGSAALAAGLGEVMWADVDREPDVAPYWGGGQQQEATGVDGYHLLVQHALRRKATVGGRFLRFLAQTGLWAKLTEGQQAGLLEGCERVAACQVLCVGLIGSDGSGSSGVSPALTELLRAHAMRRWGEDLLPDARQRLEQGGLPPLDLFLANPSAVARKLASLQAARADYVSRTNRGAKEQVEASVALTNVILRALEAAVKERQRLTVEYGINVAAARGGWLAEEEALQVLQQEVVHLGTWLTRQTNIAPGSPQQAFIGAMAARLGRLWLREGAVGGRWSPSEAKGWKRVAVETVEDYGLVHEALELARESEAWDVLGELEFRHRGLIGPQALWQDMQAHREVAHHVLNWLLDNDQLDHVLEYGGSSAAAKRELEQLFAQRPDKPAAARLAWMHHVQTRDFRRATADLRALADEAPALDLKRLWVDLGLLNDQAAMRHPAEGSVPEGDAAREELRKSLQEDQDLLAAQSQLAAIFSSHAHHAHRQPLPQDSAAAAAVLARGQCLEPGMTVRALIEQVARRPTREGAVDAALMAMDLIDYHVGRRESSLPGVKLDSEVPRLWAGVLEWRPDWDGVWRQCGSRVDAAAGARALERTAFAMAVRRYLCPAEQGIRADYPRRLCEPTDTRLQASMQLLLRVHKHTPDERALAQALIRVRNTVQWDSETQ